MDEIVLTSLEIDQQDIETLNSYAIITVEQLLGASFGLTKTDFLALLKEPEQLITAIKAVVSQEEIDKYKKSQKSHPTGLLMRDK